MMQSLLDSLPWLEALDQIGPATNRQLSTVAPQIYNLTVAGVRYLEALRQCDAILRDPDRSPAEES